MRLFSVVMLALALPACRIELGAPGERAQRGAAGDRPSGKLWVYTSLYRHVVDELAELAKEKLPDVQIEWFAAGSEKVAARLDAELEAGGARADLLLTSDPFYFARLKREGRLLPYVPPAALRLPRELLDPDGAWITTRAATMVLIYNTQLLTPEQAPRGYLELTEPAWKGKVIIGDPLASGTYFTTVAFLVERFGWRYFERLRDNGVISSGGNSTVLERVGSGELSAGLCLLENVLTSARKGSPVAFLLPVEGPVVIPGPVAILKNSANPVAARALVDLLVSSAGQAVMVRGDMHSPDPRIAPPLGAPPFGEVLEQAFPWSEAFIDKVEREAGVLRSHFSEVLQR